MAKLYPSVSNFYLIVQKMFNNSLKYHRFILKNNTLRPKFCTENPKDIIRETPSVKQQIVNEI